MNGTLSQNLASILMPALEASQGRRGVYARGLTAVELVAIPTGPDWESESDHGTVIEEFTELVFLVSAASWTAAGFTAPQQSDRFTVTLADGVERTYALLAKKGIRPWSLDATGNHYALRMKWVKA